MGLLTHSSDFTKAFTFIWYCLFKLNKISINYCCSNGIRLCVTCMKILILEQVHFCFCDQNKTWLMMSKWDRKKCHYKATRGISQIEKETDYRSRDNREDTEWAVSKKMVLVFHHWCVKEYSFLFSPSVGLSLLHLYCVFWAKMVHKNGSSRKTNFCSCDTKW